MKNAFQRLLEHPDFAEGRVWVRRRAAANEMVFKEGEAGHEVFVVLSGTVRVLGSVELDAKRRIQPGFCDLTVGGIFGELALFDAHPRSASVMAVTDCELAAIDGDQLFAFFDEHPEIGYSTLRELMSLLVDRLRKTNKKLFSLFAWGLKVHDIGTHL